MSQINPFRGIIVPSAQPQRVQLQKDHRQRRRPPKEEKPQTDTPDEKAPGDEPPRLDLKA